MFRYTQRKSVTSATGYSVYAFFLNWPDNNIVELGAPVVSANTKVQLLGYNGPDLSYMNVGKSLEVSIPYIPPSKMPCDYGWVLKFDNLKNDLNNY